MGMSSEERKEKVAELRKYHEPTFKDLGINNAYFVSKYPHIPEGEDSKFIGFYESECSKGDDIYIECCDMLYRPLDQSRMLYVWKHNPNYASIYKVKKEQYLIPVSELHVVSPVRINLKEVIDNYSVNTSPPKAPIFIKKEEIETIYKEEIFESEDGSKHTIKFKNGIPNVYTFMPAKGSLHPEGFKLSGAYLVPVINFIKQLKY